MAFMRLALVCLWLEGSSAANPIEQTLKLLTMLQATITNDGDRDAVAYEKYLRWCHTTAWDRNHEVKTAERKQAKLKSGIELAKSDIRDAKEQIETLTKTISQEEGKLKAATEVRAADKAAFKSSEAKLVQTIALVDKAVGILVKSGKGKAKMFMQMPAYVEEVSDILAGLAVVVDAAGLPVEDGETLTALLQESEEQPKKKKAYESRSGGILELLKNLRAKAETLLKKSRHVEKQQKHTFELLKLELEDLVSNAKKEMTVQKAIMKGNEKEKAEAEGTLAVTMKQLKESKESLGKTQATCMARAADHEQSVKTRDEELKALAAAKAEIQASLGGGSAAQKRTYSLLQVTSESKSNDRKVISMLKKLASAEHSQDLEQLASRVAAVTRYGEASGEDPFKKVKGLIRDMIFRLQREQAGTKRAKIYCGEAKKSKARTEDIKDSLEELKGKADKVAAASAGIKAEVKDLQLQLADLAKQQQEMNAVRAEQNKAYLIAKADLQKGVNGCHKASRILRDYYAADAEKADVALMQDDASEYGGTDDPKAPAAYKKSSGAGAGIIGLLEVVESDLAKSLAEAESEEDVSRSDYEKLTQQNKVTKIEKDKDIEYNTQKFKALDKSLTELTSDKGTAQEELAAVKEYYKKVKKLCNPDLVPYAKRKQKRKKLIQGLEQALSILAG